MSQGSVSCLQGPQCVLIVPTKELGVQMALLIYKLFGGSLNPGIPGNAANLYTYKGPRGIKVGLTHAALLDALLQNQGWFQTISIHCSMAQPDA